MIRAKLVLAVIALVAFVYSSAIAGYDLFTEDVDLAIEQAKKEKKDLLLLFTGSDWCPPCKKLEEEVFAQTAFQERVPESFVLVKFDFPQNKPQSPELAKQNDEWAKRFGISGYPTVMILDTELRPIGFLGYIEGGPESFLREVDKLREKRIRRDAAFEKLEQAANDDERAQLLDLAISELDMKVIEVYYAKELEEIDRIDADNHLGLRSKYFEERDAEVRKEILLDVGIQARLAPIDDAINFIDAVIGTVAFTPEEKFDVLQIKLGLLQKEKRFDAANELIDQMLSMEGLVEETKERLLVRKLMQMASAGKIDEAMGVIELTLGQPGDHLLIRLAHGELLIKADRREEALKVFQDAAAKARLAPDILIELVGNQADLMFQMNQQEESLKALDNFAEDTQMPVDLRCEALLHESMLMRKMGRTRPAMLMENRAIELADSPELIREIRTLVEQMRSNKKE